MQTKRPHEDVEYEEAKSEAAARKFHSAIYSPANTINTLVKIKSVVTGQDFEVTALEDTPIIEVKLMIEESQQVALNDQILLYNGTPVKEDGFASQLMGQGVAVLHNKSSYELLTQPLISFETVE